MYEYKKILFFTLTLLLILADQVSKYIIRTQGGFYICNTSLAFGLKLFHVLIITIPLVLISLLFFTAGNYKSKITNLKQTQNSKWFKTFDFDNCNLFGIYNFGFGALVLILSGGISNLIDRAYLGCVIDFIDLKFWPVFNLADIYITIGAIALMILYVFQSPVGRDHRPQK